jgi:NAD(P)-dependent dehydrogenase (short-subunit alcohol dehydrogenase family)
MKQILVIGGGGGLGSALVLQLLAATKSVVVAGRTKPANDRVTQFFAIDATTVDWASLYRSVEQETGQVLDAVIFVSGTAVFGKTSTIPIERARKTFELNFWACARAAQTAAAYWEDKQLPGKFVAVLSIAARRGVPFEAYYSASKAAAARFLECLQLEYGHKHIEFLSAFPGMLNTGFRHSAEWYGFQPSPNGHGGSDVQKTAAAIIRMLEGKRRTHVVGLRERTIDLADRLLPGLYDRAVLRKRALRMLQEKDSG